MSLLRSGYWSGGYWQGYWSEDYWPGLPVCPMTLDEIKDHLRVVDDDDDTLINQLLKASMSWAEMFQRRLYIERNKFLYYDNFPEIIRPPYSPLVKILYIQYVDPDGNNQTLDADNYRVDTDSEPGRITIAHNCYWPDTRNLTNAVKVKYRVGYGGAADVPDEIKSAIKLLISHWYENRDAVAREGINRYVPEAAVSLLWRRKIIEV